MTDRPTPADVVPSRRHYEKATEILVTATMKRANEINISYQDLVSYFEGLAAESDRAAGILSFVYIESQITDLFVQQLDSSVPGGTAAIVGPQGILDSTGAQIRMLRALRWLRPETFGDLRLLARIRNRFAHAHTALTFADDKVRSSFDAVTKYEENINLDEFKEVKLTVRDRFLVRSIMTLFQAYGDLCLIPSALSVGFSSGGAMSAGYDKFPNELQNALATCVGAIEAVYRHAASRL